jgi:uncharacterized membrane protein (Fun14 family)
VITAKRVNTFAQRAYSLLFGWAGDGPWRSKSVLAALAAVLVGLWSWCSDLKNSSPQPEANVVATNAAVITPANPAAVPAGTHWNWSKPLPAYVRLGASYVAGFCIGWFFRKLIRIVVVVAALVIALLVFGKYAGCDTAPAQERVKRGGEWAQHEATVTQDYLMHLLPSATGGGAGIFLGFRRRSKSSTPQPAG